MVSHKLSKADFVGLRGLVEDKEIERLRKLIEPMDAKLRSKLAAFREEIIWHFTYRIDVSVQEDEDDADSPKRFFVEIMTIFHAVKEEENGGDSIEK